MRSGAASARARNLAAFGRERPLLLLHGLELVVRLGAGGELRAAAGEVGRAEVEADADAAAALRQLGAQRGAALLDQP